MRYRIGDREFSAAGNPDEALKLLARSVGTKPAASLGTSADWPLFRGSPARDGRGDWNASPEPGRVGSDAGRGDRSISWATSAGR